MHVVRDSPISEASESLLLIEATIPVVFCAPGPTFLRRASRLTADSVQSALAAYWSFVGAVSLSLDGGK